MKNSKPVIPIKFLYWSSQISTMSIEVAMCIGLGYWADASWGTAPLYLLIGAAVGFLVSVWHLYRLVQSMNRS